MVCGRSDHNVLLIGPPGAGTSMLARRLTTILPPMTLAETVETTRIQRVAGLIGTRIAWVTTHLCRAPHHTFSDVGLIGGGHVLGNSRGRRWPSADATFDPSFRGLRHGTSRSRGWRSRRLFVAGQDDRPGARRG
jgi:hypothetical protein